jgi:hypothetical protein
MTEEQAHVESTRTDVNKDPIAQMERRDVEIRFGPYRPPTPVTKTKYEAIQQKSQELALLIQDTCPTSKQKATALTLLEQVKMSANAAIAIHS